MSEGVLTAVIAAGATITASVLQLRTSLAKEFAARSTTANARRKSRLPLILLSVMLAGAVVGGFALAQWLHEDERVAQNALERDLRERISDLSKAQGELQQARSSTHAEIEAEILRRMGAEGIVVLATVAPCKPRLGTQTMDTSVSPSAGTSSVATSACSESDAAPIILCATVPLAAKLTGIELFVRVPDTTMSWDTSRAMPGQEIDQTRFSEKLSEVADGATSRQVCEGFRQWAAESRIARMVVHYTL
jgi:hypothetical protein